MKRQLKSIALRAGWAALFVAVAGPAVAQNWYGRYDGYDRYDRYDRYERQNRRSRDREQRPTESTKQDSADISAQPPIGPAVLAVVSLRHQRVSVYDAQGRAVRAGVSSGQSDYETPVGVYSILQKNRDHYSNLYDDASMPFMQRLTWSGIALHAGALPGHPASHGCVRLPHSYAERIFDQTKLGMRVIVARDDRAPVEISHAKLFKPSIDAGAAVAQAPTPIAYDPAAAAADQASPFEPDLTNWPERKTQLEALRPDAKAKAAEAASAKEQADELKKVEKAKAAKVKKLAKPLARAERNKKRADEAVEGAAKRLASARTDKARQAAEKRSAAAAKSLAEADAALAQVKSKHEAASAEAAKASAAFTAAETAKAAAVAAAAEARGKMLPVSVFVSLKTQRAYVRQGHEAMFDMPVTISDPDVPIGTHVFTAVDYADGGNGVRWMATALPARADDDAGAYDRERRASKTEPSPPTDATAAGAVLDRITFPPEFVTRVSGYVWPRSSLIVSDEEASKETGNATDFVVLISGEPQGGIKKRPKQPPPGYYGYDYYVYGDEEYYDRRSRRRPRYYNSPFFSFW